MSNLFEVGMWVKDMSRGRIAKIVDIGKELVRLEVKKPLTLWHRPPHQHSRGIPICSESWLAFVWEIEFLTEEDKLALMVEVL